MFSSTILAIAITLVFVYLVLAIMVTGINEMWFTLSRQRAKQLENFLKTLFFDKEWRETLFKEFNKSPFIHVLQKAESKFPAAIPASNFSHALLTIVGEGKADLDTIKKKVREKEQKGEFYKLLDSLLSQTDNIEKLKKELETIFDHAMERVTGWYKRNAKILSFILAILLCGSLNIDTLNIAGKLWKDKNLADKVATFATEASKNFEKNDQGGVVIKDEGTPVISMTVKDTTSKGNSQAEKQVADSLIKTGKNIQRSYQFLTGSGIPMGWNKANIPPCEPSFWKGLVMWMLKVLGILLTAIAVSLGAPFWFDILTRVTPLRKSQAVTPAAAGDASGPSK